MASGGLFVIKGTYVTLTLEDLRVVTSEDVVSAGDRSFANVRMALGALRLANRNDEPSPSNKPNRG